MSAKETKEIEAAAALAGALEHVKQAEDNLVAVMRQSNVDRDVDLVERAADLRAAYDQFNAALYPPKRTAKRAPKKKSAAAKKS